jgi:hypothetical protein
VITPFPPVRRRAPAARRPAPQVAEIHLPPSHPPPRAPRPSSPPPSSGRTRTLLAPPGSAVPAPAGRCRFCGASWGGVGGCAASGVSPQPPPPPCVPVKVSRSSSDRRQAPTQPGCAALPRGVGLSGRSPGSYRDALLGGLASPDVLVASYVVDHKQNRRMRYRRRKQNRGLKIFSASGHEVCSVASRALPCGSGI